MKRVSIQSGVLQSFLSKHRPRLSPSTTIIISSSKPPREDNISQRTDRQLDKFHNKLQNYIQQCHFMTSLQFNLRTITYGGCGEKDTGSSTSHSSQYSQNLSSAFPTKSNVQSAVEMMKRVGVTNVIGVGSGVAMDLAKICYSHLHQESFNRGTTSSNSNDSEGQLILVPGTLGGIMASVSTEELVLNTEEEALIPSYFERDQGNHDKNTSTSSRTSPYILIDENMIAIPDWMSFSSIPSETSNNKHNEHDSRSMVISKGRKNVATMVDAALASLSICFDVASRLDASCGMENDYTGTILEENILKSTASASIALQTIQSMVNEGEDMDSLMKTARQHAIQSVLHAGQLLTFGVDYMHQNDMNNTYNECQQQQRSIPFAMSSSLLPRYFPYANWLTFTASLLPGICSAIQKDGGIYNEPNNYTLLRKIISTMMTHVHESSSDNVESMNTNELFSSLSYLVEYIQRTHGPYDGMDYEQHTKRVVIPSLSNIAHGAPSIEELMNQIDANGSFLNCFDADSMLLEQVLVSSLNR